MSNNSDALGIINRTHPKYYEKSGQWDFLLDSYDAALPIYAQRYLQAFQRESQADFVERRGRAWRDNHTKRIVNMYNNYLFAEEPVRRIENKDATDFINNADGKGQSLTRFMSNVDCYTSVLGRTYVVVDRVDPEEITGTAADNLMATPYCYLVYPQNVMDIAFDDFMNVKWAIVREYYRKDDDSPLNPDYGISERFRVWEPGRSTLVDDTGSIIEVKNLGFDFVPIIPIDHEENSDVYGGDSLVSDVVYNDLSIFNLHSDLDQIIINQTFSQLIMPVQGLAFTETIDDPEQVRRYMKMATNSTLLFNNAGDGMDPKYISPDASQAEFILEKINKQITNLYNSVNLTESVGNSSAVSGQAKAFDFDALNKVLANKADNLEVAEKKIFRMVGMIKNGTPFEVDVKYPDQFDVKTLSMQIQTAQELALLEPSETLMKEIFKTLASKALPTASKDKIKQIEKEIDEKDFSEESIASNSDFNFNSDSDDTKKKDRLGGTLGQEQSKFDQI